MRPNVIWQLTQRCDLGCRNCLLVSEGSRRGTDELTTFEAYKAIDQIATLEPKSFTITGGDPLARRDLFQLIEYARRRGLQPAVALSSTWNLTAQNLETLQRVGVSRVVVSIHGSSGERHDAVHGTPGAFARTMGAVRQSRDAGIRVGVDTLVTRGSLADLIPIAELIEPFGIDSWTLYFLVPLDGSGGLQLMSPDEAEEIFGLIAPKAATGRYAIRAIEAPHYRRFLMQHGEQIASPPPPWADFSGYIAGDDPRTAIDDEIVFITSRGEVRPSVFLPISGGNLRYRSLASIIRNGEIFSAFRSRAYLTGKCGVCEYRESCGGSRARAWAVTGDLFASDPLCAHQPAAMEVSA